MNKQNAKDYLPLVQALSDGKVIQINTGSASSPEWRNLGIEPLFGAPAAQYRIKPEPREILVNEYGYQVVGHTTEGLARKEATGSAKRVAVRYREVLE